MASRETQKKKSLSRNVKNINRMIYEGKYNELREFVRKDPALAARTLPYLAPKFMRVMIQIMSETG